MKSYLGNTALPRGIRNNNPGNLILTSIAWQGKIPNAQNTDGHFEQFTSVEYGIRALALDLINDIDKGKNTLTLLINEYAPAFENNTTAYINSLSNQLGISPTAQIPKDTNALGAIIAAIIRVENGPSAPQYITGTDIENGLNLISGVVLQKKNFIENLKEFWLIYLIAAMLLAALLIYIYKTQ